LVELFHLLNKKAVRMREDRKGWKTAGAIKVAVIGAGCLWLPRLPIVLRGRKRKKEDEIIRQARKVAKSEGSGAWT
jgi:hypothetical protein